MALPLHPPYLIQFDSQMRQNVNYEVDANSTFGFRHITAPFT